MARKEVTKDGAVIGYYDTERGPLGHIFWEAVGKPRRSGGSLTISDALRSIAKAFEESRAALERKTEPR